MFLSLAESRRADAQLGHGWLSHAANRGRCSGPPMPHYGSTGVLCSRMGSTIAMPTSRTELALREADRLEDELASFFEMHYERVTRVAALVCHAGVPAEDAV